MATNARIQPNTPAPAVPYEDTRDKAIETFIQDPTYGKGVRVRKAGAGVREFTYGGGSVYTWSADQEKADRDEETRVDDNRTFAELLTLDLPARVARADRSWREAGDIDSAKAELEALDKFARDNRDTLRTLTRYRGQDDLAKGVADRARWLVSGEYRLKFATMEQDSEIRAKVAQKRALDMGLDAESADVFKRMTADKDPEAIALWNASGAPAQVESRPGVTGKGATPQAARAAAAGIDPADIKGFIRYAKTAGAKLAGNVEKPVLDLMSPDDRAKALRMSYDSGDKESGGLVLDTAARIARSADGGTDGRGKLNAFQSALVASNEAMQAWGDAGDPARRAMGVKIMASLADSLPGTAFVSQKQQVVGVMKSVSSALDQYRNLGVDFDEKKAAVYARAVYNRTYRPAVPLSGEEARMADVMTKANMYGGNITVSTRSVDPRSPGAAEDSGGYTLLAGVLRDHVRGAAAAAMANGTAVEKEMLDRSDGLAQMLQSLGVPDQGSARNAARLLSQTVASGEEIDVSRITQILGQDDTIRKMVEQANGKKVAAEANTTAPVVSAVTGDDALFSKAMDTALAAEEARDKASGVTRTREERVAAAKVAANNDPNVRFAQTVEGLKVQSRYSVAEAVRRGGSVLTGAIMDRPYIPKPVAEVAAVLEGVASGTVFESSPMYRYLYDTVKSGELDTEETRAAAVALVKDTYSKQAGLAARVSNVVSLQDFAASHVDRVISNIKTELELSGVGDASKPARSILGSGDPDKQKRIARGVSGTLVARIPGEDTRRRVSGVVGLVTELSSPLAAPTVAARTGVDTTVLDIKPRNEWTSEDVARQMSLAIFEGADMANDSELATFARTKLENAKSLPPKAPIAENKKTTGGGLTFNLVALGGSDKVRSGYKALAKLDQKLGRPIEDSAVRKLAFVDLPNLMSDLPQSKKARGYRVINKMLDEGADSDAMLQAFEEALGADERRAAEAKKAADAEKIQMQARASGVNTFGAPANDVETAPGTK
jgi:hypothetical protein